MAEPFRTSLDRDTHADLGRSEGLRRARVLPAGLRAMALGEALPWLDAADRRRAAIWLVRRAARGERRAPLAGVLAALGRLVFGGHGLPASQEAIFQLARNWHAVPEGLRRAALEAGPPAHWMVAIERAAMEGDPKSRAAAAELAGMSGSWAALRLVVPMLADEDRGVAQAAERALVRATGRAAELDAAEADPTELSPTNLGPGAEGPGPVEGVDTVIADAVAGFDQHRRFGVLLSALALLTEADVSAARRGVGTPLANWLAQKPTSQSKGAHAALRTVLRKADLPLARQRALAWITTDHLAQAAGDRLARASTPAEHEAVLERAYLTRRRLRASRVASLHARPRIRPPKNGQEPTATPPTTPPTTPPIDWPEACPVPSEATIERLSAHARAGLAEWLAALDVDRATRARVLAPRLADEQPRVRLSLTRFAPPTIIEDLAFDPHPGIARSATFRLSHVGDPLEAIPAAGQPVDPRLRALARHPDPGVRAIGQQELARAGQGRSGPSAVCAARAALKRTDPQATWLVEAIEAGEADGRIAAIVLARQLGLSATNQSIQDALLAAVMAAGPAGGLPEDDARQFVAATALRALSIAPGVEASRAIMAACRYPAPRVRANAVEALEDRRRRGLSDAPAEHIADLTGDAHQRVRANAVRGGLVGVEAKPDPAIRRACESALLAMLGDERAAHRLSGLWVASRVLRRGPERAMGKRWTDLAAIIADMARHDSDAATRARAAACLGSLEAEARQRWRQAERKKEAVA